MTICSAWSQVNLILLHPYGTKSVILYTFARKPDIKTNQLLDDRKHFFACLFIICIAPLQYMLFYRENNKGEILLRSLQSEIHQREPTTGGERGSGNVIRTGQFQSAKDMS